MIHILIHSEESRVRHVHKIPSSPRRNATNLAVPKKSLDARERRSASRGALAGSASFPYDRTFYHTKRDTFTRVTHLCTFASPLTQRKTRPFDLCLVCDTSNFLDASPARWMHLLPIGISLRHMTFQNVVSFVVRHRTY